MNNEWVVIYKFIETQYDAIASLLHYYRALGKYRVQILSMAFRSTPHGLFSSAGDK